MFKIISRVAVVKGHLQNQLKACSSTTTQNAVAPSITVTPSVGMVDEKVKIQLSGLEPSQTVTLIANVIENQSKFESRCVYKADDKGEIDNFSSVSLDGTFKGIEPMGLFWSLRCPTESGHSARLIKKDVASPMDFNIKVYPGTVTEEAVNTQPLSEVKVQRFYQRPGVKRIPLTGKVKGAMFIPEGEGPFPALVDMYGGLVSLIETRAALLASHGYATLALSYIYGPGLPQTLMGADFNYIRESYEWLMEQEYVDKKRLGAVGLCYGGTMCLTLASALHQIKAVVNINGIEIVPKFHSPGDTKFSGWPDITKVYDTDEGVVINEVYDCVEPFPIPAWEHGAKILLIYGDDDKQVHPKWHGFYYDHVPSKFKQNIQIIKYTGAGHMIEPPFAPHIRAVTPGRKRMTGINFMPQKFYDKPMMAGGWPEPHAHAQEDAWKKVLDFLDKNVKNAR